MAFINRKQEIYPYIVVLKRKNTLGFWLLSMMISFLFLIYLVWKAMATPDWYIILAFMLALSGLCTAHIITFLRKRKMEMANLYFTAILAFFVMPFKFALILAVITYLGYLATRPEEIGFAEDHILVKKLFTRTIKWEELNNALIKDGLLTLDFKNNKLFQAETDDEEDNEEYDVSEEEFNAFCKAHLKP